MSKVYEKHVYVDGIAAEFGVDSDLIVSHSGTAGSLVNATGNLTIQNTDTNDKIILKLGTATSATAFEVQSSAGASLFSVNGAGAVSFPGDQMMSDSGSIGLSGSSGSTLTVTLDSINAGAGAGHTVVTADDAVKIGDAGNPTIDFPGTGAITATGNPTVNLGTAQTTVGSLGIGADVVVSRQAANVAELGSGDSLYSVGAASIGRRNASADANPTAAITANGLELGAGGGTAATWAIGYSAANVAALAAGDSLSISNTGELINDRFVKVSIVATGGTGTNDGTLDVDVLTLDGVAVARAKKIKIVANSTEGSGETLDASITFGTPTLGSIVSTGAGYCYALTDATGNFACTITNSADDTTYVSAMSSDGGVASAGQGCVVVESVIDSAVWAP